MSGFNGTPADYARANFDKEDAVADDAGGFPRLTFKVSFEMSAREKDVEWFGRPTDEWIEEMVAGPGSIWKLRDVDVTEEK